MKACLICASEIQAIKEEIIKRGTLGNCDSCESNDVYTLDMIQLAPLLQEMVIATWNETSYKLKHQNRFFHSVQFEQLFSNAINKAVSNISKNFVLFRSRLEGITDNFGNVVAPYPPNDMGAPPISKTRSGRANTRGIICLYTASSIETAIAEVRPWKDANVTVSRIITNIDLVMIDLVTITKNFESVFPNLTLTDLINYYLILLWGYELSKPISSLESSEIEYVPTQIFTEFVKYKGFDGIIYKSSLGQGDNIVIFDQNKVTIIDSNIYTVKDISYTIE